MGIIIIAANTLGIIKKLIGFVLDTSIVSICSDTRMELYSAPMLDPIFPAHNSAVIIGPISRMIEIVTIPGNIPTAPNLTNAGHDCMVITNPIIILAMEIKPTDLFQTDSIDFKILETQIC